MGQIDQWRPVGDFSAEIEFNFLLGTLIWFFLNLRKSSMAENEDARDPDGGGEQGHIPRARFTRRGSLGLLGSLGIGVLPVAGGASSPQSIYHLKGLRDAHHISVPADVSFVCVSGEEPCNDDMAVVMYVSVPGPLDAEALKSGLGFTDREGRSFQRMADSRLLLTKLQSPVAGSGSDAILHRRTEGAKVTSVHGKLRHTVLAQEDYGFSSGNSAADNAVALQRAIDDAQVVILPSDGNTVAFSSHIQLPPSSAIIGGGFQRSRLKAEGPLGFLAQAPTGTAEIEAPRFADFSLHCALSGVKVNDAASGFSDSADTQSYMMECRIDRVRIGGPGAQVRGAVGIEWNKVFHGIIDQCGINGFETGLKALGCDLCELRGRSRVSLCGTLLQIESVGHFGSGFKVDGCDLLVPLRTFLKASDRHLLFLNNYLESQDQPLSGPVLDLAHSYIMIFQNNRFEVPAFLGPDNQEPKSPVFMNIEGDGVLFVFENNATKGPPWGEVIWNGSRSARYFFNSLYRQQIISRGNNPTLPSPFNTQDPPPVRNRRREHWIISPDTEGLVSTIGYGVELKVDDGAFRLPAMPKTGSLVAVRDRAYPIRGTVDIYVQAHASVDGQMLTVARFDRDSFVADTKIPLSIEPQWYAAFTGVAVRDLTIQVYNSDLQHAGDVSIAMIVVEASR